MPVQHLPHRHFFLSGYGQLSQLKPMTTTIGSGSSYGFELAAGGGKIRVSDASDKNFVFFGKDTLQQNADAPNKLNLATKNGDVEVEFVR